jgi:hypothetical protein
VTSLERGVFNRAFREQVETRAITDPVIAAGAEMAAAYASIGTIGFESAVPAIQESFNALIEGMNPDQIETALETLSNAVPSIRGLVSLTTDQIARLGSAGGMAALRDFSVFDRLAQDIYKDAAGNFDEVEGAKFLDDILNRLIAVNPEDRAELGSRLMQEVLAGMTNVPVEAQQRVANAIQDFLIPDDLDSIINAAFGTSDVIDKLFDLFGKGFNISKEDMDFLTERFPGSVVDILNGTADLNALQEETTKELLNILDLREADLVQIYLALDAAGELTQQARERLELDLQEIQLGRAKLTQSRALTDDVKARFEAERESLKVQRSAIDEAKRLRDLQDRAREVSALSTQATRIGAVGTIEARFNQEQLQAQIKQMNRDLEERIQIAKIEAQDRILEETQRRQLIKAQEETVTALYTVADVFKKFTEDDGSPPNVRFPAGAPRSPGGPFNDLTGLVDQ